MDDPKSIGPAMAVALLTTLYGAVFANMIALPIADKLAMRKTEESRLKAICIDGVLGIVEGQNPACWSPCSRPTWHRRVAPRPVATTSRTRSRPTETSMSEFVIEEEKARRLAGDLRRPHVPADASSAAAVLLRDGCAEVQADRRLHEGSLRRPERGQGQGHSQGHQVIAQEFSSGRPRIRRSTRCSSRPRHHQDEPRRPQQTAGRERKLLRQIRQTGYHQGPEVAEAIMRKRCAGGGGYGENAREEPAGNPQRQN